jgi:hypothetical protein
MEDVGAEGIVKVGNSKRIDMNCQWMQNYKASAGRKQRRHTPSPAAQNRGLQATPQASSATTSGLPSIEDLNHYEQFEKVRKMQIDNETKLGNLTANQLIVQLMENLDDFFIKLTIDGESSMVPKIYDKAVRDDSSVLDCKKIYRQSMAKQIKGVKSKMIKFFTDEIEKDD